MMFDFRYLFLNKKQTSMEDIKVFMEDQDTKRIHFATSHSRALKPGTGKYHGFLNVPFNHTIGPTLSQKFEGGMSQYIFTNNGGHGYYRGFRSNEDYESCKSFVEEYNQIVFLRDTLDLSLALSMNIQDEESRTQIGELEYQAKFKDNEGAENCLVELVQEWLKKLPFYNTADAICAMPCSKPERAGLPRRIVDRIEGYENISSALKWKKKDKSIKELGTVEEKLAALQEFELEITSDLKGKNVILLDDLYMSGISMQFVAMKLKEAGVDRVFGISIVKSRSNTAL
jgi:hypothetical protein